MGKNCMKITKYTFFEQNGGGGGGGGGGWEGEMGGGVSQIFG